MLSKLTPRRRRLLILAVLAIVILLGAIQVRDAIQRQRLALQALQEMKVASGAKIEDRKTQQEAVEAWRNNREKTLFWTNLASPLNASITILLSLFGALGTAIAFLEAREKERQDRRDALEKDRAAREATLATDREERLAAAFSEMLRHLVSNEPRERVVGASSLIFFLSPERPDYHLRAVGALVAALRNAEDAEVRQGLRLAAEFAVRTLDTATLTKLSWQGVRLREADLSGFDLSEIDLRDADLQNARLVGTTLVKAKLVNAQLQGADLTGADLSGAEMVYADLAGATLAQAKLKGANLAHIRVLNLDLQGAEIDESVGEWRNIPWDATKNWREASFSSSVREALVARYGKEAPDLQVLMLMWEVPPFVAGGTWTACYHLLRQLHRRGAKVTVVVPWARDKVADSPFGIDVPIIDMGMEPPAIGLSPYGVGYGSAYGPVASVYGFGGASPYGLASSPYGTSPFPGRSSGGPGLPNMYSGVGRWGPYVSSLQGGSTLYALISEFKGRVLARLIDQRPDVIHAHDWVTFDAARGLAEAAGRPWIAHFHSTEAERQPSKYMQDELTRRIEQGGVDSAAQIIVPSKVTRDAVLKAYRAKAGRIEIIPNLFSEQPRSASELGRFETKRVIFLGRLSEQKGVGRFVEVANKVHSVNGLIKFEAYGEGPEEHLLRDTPVRYCGALQWGERSRAFRGATSILVPSIAEPFGMVILEAMQHRVPVIYSDQSGAAEVLKSGFKLPPDDIIAMAKKVRELADDLKLWEQTVSKQAAEIEQYPGRNYEDLIIATWNKAVADLARPSAIK